MLHQNEGISPKSKNMKTSIIFYPNKVKKNIKTGMIPMYMRVILGRQKAETRLDADIVEKEIGFGKSPQ
jgi:hypothetical protein